MINWLKLRVIQLLVWLKLHTPVVEVPVPKQPEPLVSTVEHYNNHTGKMAPAEPTETASNGSFTNYTVIFDYNGNAKPKRAPRKRKVSKVKPKKPNARKPIKPRVNLKTECS